MSYTLDEVKAQMEGVGIRDLFGTKREVKELPKILNDDENDVIKYGCSGLADGNTVLAICTNQRVLFIDKGLIYGIRSTEIPLDMVNGVSYKKGLVFGAIAITNGATVTKLENIAKKDAPVMADTIKQQAALYKQSLHDQAQPQIVTSQSTSSSNVDQVIEDLYKLKTLVDEGIISQEEFEAKKKQMLNI